LQKESVCCSETDDDLRSPSETNFAVEDEDEVSPSSVRRRSSVKKVRQSGESDSLAMPVKSLKQLVSVVVGKCLAVAFKALMSLDFSLTQQSPNC